MNIKLKRTVAVLTVTVAMCATMSSCGFLKPYDEPEFVTIEPHQTAFMIPLVGDTENQASFESEALLREAKIAAKEVQIPHRWVQTGRRQNKGEWRDAARLIVVDRSPVTREWSQSTGTGTSTKNQAIYAESKESIGYSVGMNCSAQIDTEDDAVCFLYSYNNKALSQIMDTEIRAMVESKFNEESGKRTMNEILANKEMIMKNVRDYVIPYFKDKGITITVLGMKDGIEYKDKNIQKSINDKFSSEMELTTQKNENERIVSEAKAKAEADKILEQSITPELLEKIKLEKWDGHLPMVSGSSTPIVNIGK